MLSNVASWAAQPFSEDMDVWKWAIFVVVIVTVAVLWLQILNHIIAE
jgi:hypothetical protein